ncbi:large ribosomal subunit protein mL52 isoform X1 [Paramormyrops kingsleyae]|uniref:large ribosomal subunit protein mL52 isoform X1 n=1 Tax=Paramormyrops kingsleyae TaxID=1676925 RepID=UPI000CD5E5DD|nr:39S ribosomal protein L52, mitochondrial isoform X2 [Paramormyrops kingsleyae]
MAVTTRVLCSAYLLFFPLAFRLSPRFFSLTAGTPAGSKWRLEHGLARSGSEYGPLTDLPDWSYADGRPAPAMKGQVRRQRERAEFAKRVVDLSEEMDRGMQRWKQEKEDAQAMEEKKKSLRLKPKGRLLLETKKSRDAL